LLSTEAAQGREGRIRWKPHLLALLHRSSEPRRRASASYRATMPLHKREMVGEMTSIRLTRGEYWLLEVALGRGVRLELVFPRGPNDVAMLETFNKPPHGMT
jgi:hypothetical protein